MICSNCWTGSRGCLPDEDDDDELNSKQTDKFLNAND